MPITWTPALETGLRHIDLQHQELIEMINAAEAAERTGRSEEALQEILPRLTGYVLFHFGTEESLLSGPGVPAEHARVHRQAHRLFGERIAALKQAASDGDATALPQMVGYLQGWLIDHIRGTDHELARLVRSAAPRPRE